jgi:ditrans,polycis-polyprenyl diphosphate synthase
VRCQRWSTVCRDCCSGSLTGGRFKIGGASAGLLLAACAVGAVGVLFLIGRAALMNYLERLVLGSARMGPLPQHIAFIMDGNRRFATQRGRPTFEGHSEGYSSLLRVLQFCLALQEVKVVTVYAFSIDNFKRPAKEVDTLMQLAQDKFTEFLKHEALVMQHDVRVRVLGDLSLLPDGVKRAAAHVMHATAGHTRLTLNICFSYTSSEEVASTVRSVVAAAREGEILKGDIDEAFISRCLYTRGSPADLLIRTSGETRLSDFLVLQCNRAHLCFLDVTWPEVDVWRFLACVWDYQAHHVARKPASASHAVADANADADGDAHEHRERAARKARQDTYLAALERRELEQCKLWM